MHRAMVDGAMLSGRMRVVVVARVARDALPAASELLDADVGILIVSRRGRLLSANPIAETVPARLGFLAGTDGTQLVNLANFEVFDEARQRVAASPETPVIVRFLDATGEGESFAYIVEAGAAPASLLATLPPWSTSGTGELAILLPVAGRNEQFWSGIRKSFGLTAAEVRLTARLTDGMTLKEAAADLKLSVNTLDVRISSDRTCLYNCSHCGKYVLSALWISS